MTSIKDCLHFEDLSGYGITFGVARLNQLERKGAFPRRRRIGRKPVWIRAEIDAWIASKLA